MKQEGFEQVYSFLRSLDNSSSEILNKAFNYRTNEFNEEKQEAN